MDISENIKNQAKLCAEKFNLQLISICFKTQGKDKILEVILDKKGGISLKDITLFTEEFNLFLDKCDELNFTYQLDCSSPGAERFIVKEELPNHLNDYMEITFNNKKVTGTLRELNENNLILKHFIKGRPKKEDIKLDDIKKIQLKIKF